MEKKYLDWHSKSSKDPFIIAGPCSAETEKQVLLTAHQIDSLGGINVYRAGIWKPRTRPNSFEGVGTQGLSWLKKVQEETSLMVTTEIANAHHVEQALKNNIDIIWIGARTSVNPFSVQEIANALKGTNIPVMVKNPMTPDLSLWIGAIERILKSGPRQVAAIHRGFPTHEKNSYRNPPLWKIPIALKSHFPDLPILCDPSHICGQTNTILSVSQKALNLNMDGLMIESHHDPSNAWSDADQQITPLELKELLESINLKPHNLSQKTYQDDLLQLRCNIDDLDQEIIHLLKLRFELVDKIGKEKIKNNIMILQLSRMKQMINDRIILGKKSGLNPDFIKKIYHIIHEESFKYQTKLIKEKNSHSQSNP